MRLRAPHHVSFDVTDLDQTEEFAKDFGLITVERTDQRLIMRTGGGDRFAYVAYKSEQPRYRGMAFEVEDQAELTKVASKYGSEIQVLDLPGGGKIATLVDPDGFLVQLVHGIARREPDAAVADLVLNRPSAYARPGRYEPKRDIGPAKLFRLGHVGIFVKNFAASRAWYQDVLGLIASEVYHIPNQPAVEIIGFMRVNRGEERVDHHCVALMQSQTGEAACHHISFEAQDFEAQFIAHRFLKSRGYEQVWGVGRHPHGSHVFDVWRDPDRNRFETFSDTDLLKESDGTRIHDLHDVEMDVWSSDPPDRYFA